LNIAQPAFVAAQNWKFCMSINAILTWLRAFEHFRMFPFMGYIVRVLANAVSPVLVVMISFVVVTFSFALAYQLVSSVSSNLSQFFQMAESCKKFAIS
jgi:hypothetical protein